MKIVARITLLFLVALVAASAFGAGKTTKIDISLSKPTTFAGTTLAPGDYKVYVDRDGTNANVRITSHGKEVVKTTAAFRELAFASSLAALQVDNARNAMELQSAAIHGAIVFGPAVEQAAATQAQK